MSIGELAKYFSSTAFLGSQQGVTPVCPQPRETARPTVPTFGEKYTGEPLDTNPFKGAAESRMSFMRIGNPLGEKDAIYTQIGNKSGRAGKVLNLKA